MTRSALDRFGFIAGTAPYAFARHCEATGYEPCEWIQEDTEDEAIAWLHRVSGVPFGDFPELVERGKRIGARVHSAHVNPGRARTRDN